MLELGLEGRVALVSGGSRGIGRAVALRLAGAGAKVSIGYRTNAAAAEATLAQIRSTGGEAIATQADVATADGCAAFFLATQKAFGKVDVLINNAGDQSNGVFMLLTDEQFEQMHALHLMSVVRLSRLCASGMIARKWGRIINVSSVASQYPAVGQSNYAAAKAGIEALTRSMAVELAKRHVRVNCISPGLIETDMAAQADVPGYLSRQLVPRLGQPDEIAAWIAMLASRWGDYVTGRVLDIDGGYRLV
jgi:3-oxoacyl-[acyl-carrier protein] reductase